MLHIHRSERADRLVEGLAEVLRGPPADPFALEVVAVPARGVERWWSQRLSHVLGVTAGEQDGVCANVRFPHPSSLVAEVLGAAAGTADDDPWDPERLLWVLLETIDECAPRSGARRWPATWASARRRPASPRAPTDNCPPSGQALRLLRGPPPSDAAGMGGGRRPRSPRRPALARRAVATGPGPDRAAEHRRAARRPPATGCGPSPAWSTCRTGCRCSGRPG